MSFVVLFVLLALLLAALLAPAFPSSRRRPRWRGCPVLPWPGWRGEWRGWALR
jgi:hypothetical protein